MCATAQLLAAADRVLAMLAARPLSANVIPPMRSTVKQRRNGMHNASKN
jgi:hypothetical protein